MKHVIKMRNAVAGLFLGLVSMAVAAVVWPAFFAWFCWNESDDDP